MSVALSYKQLQYHLSLPMSFFEL
uniref:Uncharacterized protein n=1 Tax=Arundo donax TaxID=35708 RepID=A0A0A8YB27_ARUDO